MSGRPRQHRRVCCHFKRRDCVFDNRQGCSGKSTHCADGFVRGLHGSDGSGSVTLVAEFANLVSQDDILLPLCPVATEELLLCLRVNKSVHIPGHAPIWLLPPPHRACTSPWSPAPSSRVWLQKRCLLPQGNTQSAEGLHLPCTRGQPEAEAQLRRFSTVLDAANHVLEIRRTSCTRADSESVPDYAVPSQFDRGVPGSLSVAGRAGIGLS